MRAVLRFLIQVGVIILAIWLLVKYTTLDDQVVTFFRVNSSVAQTGSVTTENPGICTTPWGLRIPDGSSVYAYTTENNTCKEELRTCQEGILDGSYAYSSCNANSNSSSNTTVNNPDNNVQVAQGASCTTPWGETLNDGGYIIAYESRQSCRFEKRYCENGRLNGSFSANTCYSPTGINQSPVAVVNPTVTTVSYGYVQGTPVDNSEYEGPSRTSTNGKTTVIQSWNNNKTNPTSISANDSQYVDPVNYRNFDLTQHGCTTPWGTYIDHASWVIAYRSPTPASAGASCVYERRTCFQGVLGGSYAYSSCSLGNKNNIINNNGQDYFYPTTNYSSSKSCVTAWGETVRDGDYVLAYKNSYTVQGNACQGEYRYCKNGILQGSYQNRSCSMQQEKYTCILPWGGKIPHGSSVLAYANSSSPCASQVRTCSYGKLSGNYRYSSCESTNNFQRSCYLPWGGSIPHGAAVLAYGNAYGSCYSQRRTCYDGVLNGSYQYSSCYEDNNNSKPTWNYSYGCLYGNCGSYYGNNQNKCQLPRGGSIAHGVSVTAWSSSNGPCYSQTRTCNNGYLNGNYQYGSCSNTCQGGNCGGGNNGNNSCTTPWGQIIANGARVEAYHSPSAPCYKETRVCNNGSLGGSYQYNYCNPTNSEGNDSYGNWQSAGEVEGNVDGRDSCDSNSTNSYLCPTQATNNCTDYRQITCRSFNPLICSYEKRQVSCVR